MYYYQWTVIISSSLNDDVKMITGTEPLELVSFFIRWAFSTNIFLLRNYGFTTGFWLVIFGSKDVIRLEFEVLASHGEQIALEFKKATQDEGTMIAVAVCTR